MLLLGLARPARPAINKGNVLMKMSPLARAVLKHTSGIVFYDGPSTLDGSPVIGVITLESRNEKTGPMLQTWILPRDISPVDAVQSGQDAAVCGSCSFRPSVAVPAGRPRCYVNTAHAPLTVWQAFHRGAYKWMPGDGIPLAGIASLFAKDGRATRLGAYGDPLAIPLAYWGWVPVQRRTTPDHTGYTHQWRTVVREDLAGWQALVMASTETVRDTLAAQRAGWRTFRVSTDPSDRLPQEVVCPASREGGYRSTCNDCRLCAGTSSGTGRSVVILDHSAGWKKRIAVVEVSA